MNGGTFARRGLMAAAVLGGSFGAVAGFAGVAHANDHSTDVVCSNKATGAWTATISFASIEVKEGHPVTVHFGSASTTLTNPGPDGTASLSQTFKGSTSTEQVSWSVERNGTTDSSGVASFAKPEGCEAPPTTQPPATQPPATQPPATQPPSVQPPATPAVHHPVVTHPVVKPSRPAARPAQTLSSLPVTGGHPSPALWAGLGALGLGGLMTWLTRRQPHRTGTR